MKTLLIVSAMLLLLTCCVGVKITTAQIADHVVISEVYGGGGNAGSTFKNDFIELYNATSAPIVMNNWSVQYATASGSFSNAASKKTIFSGTIPAHGFFLIKEAQGSGGTTELPAPDASGSIALSAADGKIALANDTVVVTGPAGSNVIDFVGYGSANQFEGTGAVGALSNSTSAERKAQSSSTGTTMAAAGSDASNGNGWDSNDNAADFVIQSTQVPQNSLSTSEVPPVLGNAPPTISSISRSPFIAEVNGTDTIAATVIDNDGIVVSVKLHVKVNGGTEDSSLSMVLVSGAQYRGVIPASKHSTSSNLVEYFVSAIDDSSNYSSTKGVPQGYFVGDSRIDSIKAHSLSAVASYGLRVNGTLNVRTNTYVNGQGFIQNGSGGLQIFLAGGLPDFPAERNVKVQGTIGDFQGAYRLGMPSFSFVDTSLGTSALSPATIILPISESPSFSLEGKLVKVSGISTASIGTFSTGTNYVYHEPDSDTITVRVESNGNLNSLVGRTIPTTPVDVMGILSFSNTFQRIKPRNAADMGFDPADGSGSATITPAFRFQNITAVSETLTITGDGVNTIGGVSVTLPSSWGWTDTSSEVISGSGFAGGTIQVAGDGSSATPYVITVSGVAVTNVNTGRLIVSHLATPASTGATTFKVKTRGSSGDLANIALSPVVNINSAFEAVVSGNWSSASTWAGGSVPDSTDNVSFTTLGVTVTVDILNARCNNLTLVGSGTASNSGPVLRFESTGVKQLTVYGNVFISTLSGGLGGGNGDRGGRPQLTSNGNTSAVLIIKHNIVTSVGNSSANGNSGLNMNEGIVKLTGLSTDSIKNSAGFRLGELNVGDGISAKTIVWVPSTNSTMYVKSLRVKSGSTFFIGSASNLNANNIGNGGNEPAAVYLTGGISIEADANVIAQNSSAGESSADINLNGGGIMNDGVLQLVSSGSVFLNNGSKTLSNCTYNVNIGGLGGGFSSTHQTIGGTHFGEFAGIFVDGGDTLELQQQIHISPPEKMTLDGTLVEKNGITVIGTVEATRYVGQSVDGSFGGIGVVINASGAIPGVTKVTRTTGTVSSGGGGTSIRRNFDISPTNDSALSATIDFYYDDAELDGQDASTLALWKSTDAGYHWLLQGGTSDTSFHRIRVLGVNELSRWTAADVTHSLTGISRTYVVNPRWNMISVPLEIANDSTKVVFPTSVSPAYRYESGYVQKAVLEKGRGYWLKFASADSVSVNGNVVSIDTIDLAQGWNMIGSVSDSVVVNTLVRIPSTMVLSQLYGYRGGYFTSDKIYPAKGYWIKASVQGKIVLNASSTNEYKTSPVNVLQSFNRLTIEDAMGNEQTLYFTDDAEKGMSLTGYELPPPPAGIFDVRFASQNYVEFLGKGTHRLPGNTIVLHAASYPVSLHWHIRDNNKKFQLIDAEQKRESGRQMISAEGTTVIKDSRVREILLMNSDESDVPKSYSLGKNFPNPFNPTTIFEITLPVSGNAKVIVFDMLGKKVKTIVDGELSAGYHTMSWDGIRDDGTSVGSGIYCIRMLSGEFHATRKVVLLK